MAELGVQQQRMGMYAKQSGSDLTFLEELSARELAIQKTVATVTGTAASINQALQQQGIFAAYREIHQAYVALANFKRERSTRNEALKRAIFLSWYCEVEPPVFTGLADLDEDAVTEAYILLNKLIERGWLNDELAWMLKHYAQWDWTILQYTENKIHTLSRWINNANKEAVGLVAQPASLLAESMKRRGLMGLYFRELSME